MNARRISLIACCATLVGTLISGCKSNTPDDAALNTQVQSKLFSDQALRGESIQTAVSGGVVTLAGSVSTDSARSSASTDAAQVAGVKTVVNNLVVQQPTAATAAVAPPPAIMPSEPTPAPKEKIKPAPVRPLPAAAPAPIVRNTPPPPQAPPPPPVAQAQPMPPPPPRPVIREVTLPVGTALPVRITQTLDSETTQAGDKFTGAVATDIILNGVVVLPQGTPVTGHVDDAKNATHFKGSSLLAISLTSLSYKGERINLSTEQFSKEGEGRGKNTAIKTGGGAAVGAILGGIFGGGKGAAIGAAAGGGAGAGVNGVTRGEQVQIPSESVVRFKLSDPVIVRVITGGGSSSTSSGPTLERRSDQ